VTLLPLRPYQVQALDAIEKAAAGGMRRSLVAHAVGSGKTVTFSHLIQQRGPRALVLCHRDELIRQTVGKIHMIAPDLECGVVKAAENEVDADVVVASVQTLARPARLAQLPLGFTTVIADECHHSASPTWVRVLKHVGSFDEDGPLTVGFTATPERADGVGLGRVWQGIAHQLGMIELITSGYLADVRGLMVGTDADLSAVHVRGGDLAEAELATELRRSGALGQIAGAYVQHAADRKGVAFTPDVATAHALAGELLRRGIAAEAIDGTMPIEQRRAVLARLRTGQTQVVTNCAVLTEGFDEPSINCVVIARPTKSHPLFVQMVGRGTRLYPGKADCLVLDVTGASTRHDLVTVADLAGVSPPAMRGKTLSQAAAEKDGVELERARSTKAVDLFRSKMRWMPIEDGFCLPVGEVTLILVPRGEAWMVAESRDHRVEVVHESLPLGYAQGLGEDRARREGGSVSKRDAGWLRLAPTYGQLRRLELYGLKDTGRVKTRGQASDLITRVIARRVIRKFTQKAEASQ
jgi:superfamily II DNA or RNA helicase